MTWWTRPLSCPQPSQKAAAAREREKTVANLAITSVLARSAPTAAAAASSGRCRRISRCSASSRTCMRTNMRSHLETVSVGQRGGGAEGAGQLGGVGRQGEGGGPHRGWGRGLVSCCNDLIMNFLYNYNYRNSLTLDARV